MLIFNADDYGLTKIDSQRILELSCHRIIRSASITSNTINQRTLKENKSFDLSKMVRQKVKKNKKTTETRRHGVFITN